MKVLLRELPQAKTFVLSSDYVEGLIADLPMRQALGADASSEAGGGEAKLDFYIESDNVFARGPLNAWMELACSRCLDNMRLLIQEELMVTFLPQGKVPGENDLSDLEDEDGSDDEIEDTYAYTGEEINIEPLLRDRLLLAVPLAPRCKIDCLGLCSSCGANQNHTECNCDHKVVDIRLAALKDIKV